MEIKDLLYSPFILTGLDNLLEFLVVIVLCKLQNYNFVASAPSIYTHRSKFIFCPSAVHKKRLNLCLIPFICQLITLTILIPV